MNYLSHFLTEDVKKELYEKRIVIGSLIALFIFFLAAPFFIPPFKQASAETALQVIILGAVLSSLYMVLALGFSLIYGVAKQLKLSLGGYYVVGAYCMYFLLETVEISPSTKRLDEGLDGIVLIALVLLPIVLMAILLAVFWTVFDIREFLFVGASGIIAGGTVILFGLPSASAIVEGLYAALAVFVLALAAWYLELPRREVAFGTFILACAYPVMFLVDLPAIFISLAILAVLFTAFLAVLSDRFLLDKFRASHINTLIVTFSLALLLQSVVQVMQFPEDGDHLAEFGPEDRTLRTVVSKSSINIFGALIDNIRIIALALSILACVLLYIFIWFSKTGMALRAAAQDEEAAALAGIDIRKTTAIVSGIGMGLIALAAVFASPFAAKPLWSPYMGWWVLIMAIAVVTLGGRGSLPGSVVGAFIIGYSEILISSAPGTFVLLGAEVAYSQFSVVVPLFVVFLVMIFRPEGLFGERKELEG